MSPYHPQKSSGAPTYTAVSASLSLSGLDDFSPLDPTTLDSAEWYHHPSSEHHQASYHLPPLSPGHDHFAATAFGPGGFASHGIAVTAADMHRTLPSLSLSPLRVSFHHFTTSPALVAVARPFRSLFPPISYSFSRAFPFPSRVPVLPTRSLPFALPGRRGHEPPGRSGSDVVMTLVLAQSLARNCT